MVTDVENDEAFASGGILFDSIAQDVYRVCEPGIVLLCDYDHEHELSLQVVRQAAVAVVILSPGCLHSFTQLSIMCALLSRLDWTLRAVCEVRA